MKRHILTACLVTFAALASPAQAQVSAQQVQDSIIVRLTEQGFTRMRISNTLLGRVRIVATSPEFSREIIFNPRTGEILRDYWDELDDDEDERRVSSPSRSSSPSTSRDTDDDHDDDDGGDD